MKKMETRENNTLNNSLYVIKTFAVISIVLAHTNYEVITNEYIKSFLSIYKCIGVYIFFIVSGYFFNMNKYKNIYELLKDKFIKIGIPWIILGSISVIIMVDSFLLFCNFLLGNGSYLYFLTILLLCYIITYFLPRKNNILIYLLIFLNIVSVFLTSINIFPQTVDNTKIIFTYLNPYLNIMNWIGIFAIGILLRRKNLLEKYKDKIQNKWLMLLILYIILYTVLCLLRINMSYWNLLSMITGIVSFFAFLIISLKLSNNIFLVDIGKKSFFIYQIHMLFLGKIFNRIFPESNIFAIIRPIVTVIFIYFIVLIGKKIAEKLKLEKIYDIVLGLR